MFDRFRLKAALVEYKKRFVGTQWPDEKYKWEAVQCFQVNWDVNADDFAGMLTKALSQTSNLLASVNNFPARMITKFAEIAGEEVRAMFIDLYDESNMYQIFTYVKNRDYEFGDEEHKVSGMLLYAKTEEEIQPNNTYQMHGNQITVRTLDLNLPFSEIAEQLNEIAESHFDLKS